MYLKFPFKIIIANSHRSSCVNILKFCLQGWTKAKWKSHKEEASMKLYRIHRSSFMGRVRAHQRLFLSHEGGMFSPTHIGNVVLPLLQMLVAALLFSLRKLYLLCSLCYKYCLILCSAINPGHFSTGNPFEAIISEPQQPQQGLLHFSLSHWTLLQK